MSAISLSSSRIRSGLATLALAVLAGLLLWGIDRLMRTQAIAEAGSLARNDAAILSSGLQSELDKFILVPLVLAQDPQVQSFLSGEIGQRAMMNERLEALAMQTSAAAIYLMTDEGETLAASNWRLPTSFVGSNYRFRRYFRTAMEQGSATQFALGTVSRRPGLYVAQRIGPASDPIGIVAVKVEFDTLEASWRAATEGVYVTDRDGVVLLASNPDWRFRAATPAALEGRDVEADRQQFGIEALQPLEIRRADTLDRVLTAPLLDAQQPIALDGWELHLLVDPSPQVEAAIANGRLLLLFALAILGLAVWGWLYLRRQRLVTVEAAAAERTRTLREQLTQANRLATLGQISAGVGHEIAQPTAAARVFAENGTRMLAAGNSQGAAQNFTRIVELTERIGRITGELRRFSRRQPSDPRAMEIGQAIRGALLLLHERVESLGVQLVLPAEDTMAIIVQAEHVRLEQVLVNLLQNAIDAAGPEGEIAITIVADEKDCLLTVSDNGPGIDEALMDQLFQPFATTKADGLGLGLVISRDIMRELGGDLTASSSASGAHFTMRIPRA
ncbi:ATP-binding protein [Alteraurantiacibacter aestuarii]|uniref:histidine kinase n=1 Tax=Alteraurantiacibacter aestuarii TaxID=650004 RepID=A0A844ZLY9_9SPHN|nr:ATP-binding protein [Alteraurantiacibacter aestuarii]MXO88070.1 sensor histidine kinase [Alteraurantiacibacter aestuarii]